MNKMSLEHVKYLLFLRYILLFEIYITHIYIFLMYQKYYASYQLSVEKEMKATIAVRSPYKFERRLLSI